MGDEPRTFPRLFFLGRLHIELRWCKQCYPAITYAGSLSSYRRFQTTSGSTLPRYRYSQEPDSPSCIHFKVGSGCTATVVDLGNRFRLIVNDVECIEPKPLPKLPVASALWIPKPNFEVGAGAWILAGGTHHSCFSYDLTAEYWEDYAEIAGIEMIRIDKDTTISNFKKELRMNEVYYMLNKALC